MSNYGVSDLFRDQANKTADTNAMNIGTSFISDTLGIVISIGVYLLIASQFLMTVCDLLFIAIPPVRGLLVSRKAFNKGRLGSDLYLLGHNSGWDDLRDKRLAEAQMYAQQGNMSMYNQKMYWAQKAQDSSIESDAKRAALNDRAMKNSMAHDVPSKLGIKFDWSNRCFVSNDLQSMYRAGNPVSLISYLKRRAFSIILVVVLIMMVVVSNVFLNTGMNIGKILETLCLGILKMFGIS